jgi:hypothetical protein
MYIDYYMTFFISYPYKPIFTANYVGYNDNTTLFIDHMVTITIYCIYDNPCREIESIAG